MAPREALTREAVLDAAMALVDTEGLGALTMRRLAATLGVQAMSLYNHVSSKADLLDALAEQAFAEIDRPDPALPWPDQVRAVAVSAHRVLARHPAVPLALATDQANPASARALEPFDGLLGALYQAGFDDRRAGRALTAVMSLIWGSILLTTSDFGATPHRPTTDDRSAYLLRIDAAKLPHLGRFLDSRLAESPDEDDFGQALDLLIRGLVSEAGAQPAVGLTR